MNIFVLSRDPDEAARALCNKHVVKMVVETAQLLSTAHPADIAPYKRTHFNHPCARWARASVSNYRWLAQHGVALCAEYTARYGKIHKSQAAIEWLSNNVPELPDVGLTPFVLAVKDATYRRDDPIETYRAYYIGDKKRFARWAPRAIAPSWWPFEEAE